MLSKISNKIRDLIRLQAARRNVELGQAPCGGWDENKTLNYWREDCNQDENYPTHYIQAQNNRYEYLLSLITPYHVEKDAPILELGCNSGSGMACFLKQGYSHLTGIEINPVAVDVMKKEFPELYEKSTIINASLEESIPQLNDRSFQLVYSMFTLFAIHPKNNNIFEHIARIAKTYIVTIESENGLSAKIYPRNYKKIFEPLGFKQIHFEMTGGKIENYCNLHARVFKRVC